MVVKNYEISTHWHAKPSPDWMTIHQKIFQCIISDTYKAVLIGEYMFEKMSNYSQVLRLAMRPEAPNYVCDCFQWIVDWSFYWLGNKFPQCTEMHLSKPVCSSMLSNKLQNDLFLFCWIFLKNLNGTPLCDLGLCFWQIAMATTVPQSPNLNISANA